jgi:RND family efflux transporter MFP subunit
VVAVLPDGRGTRVGRLDFVDNAVDPASGTVRVKAVFANQDHALWPGAYVNVQLALQSLPGAVVIPQAAIVQGARGHAVFVVGDDNVAAQRPLKVLQALGTDAAVSGVQPGERLVLDGRQNLRTGTRVSERTAERPAGDQRASADPPRSADAPGSAASRPGPSATGGARTLP